MATRITRSCTRQASQTPDNNAASSHKSLLVELTLKDMNLARTIDQLSSNFQHRRSGLNEADHDLMLVKENKLKDTDFQERISQAQSAQAAAATLVFAQHEAGTAVCISPSGLLLTCAHCVHDAEDEGSGIGEKKWLLFASGQIVHVRCVAWDPKHDLALLQIIAARSDSSSSSTLSDQPSHSLPTFPYIPIAATPPKLHTPLHCIGHPGSEDLEASTSGIATDYDVLHISSGRFRGLAKGQDPRDNSEIGALRHDCWTYWGHSGAPLVEKRDSRDGSDGWMLVGLHSSWDDQTGMRRGVPLQAVRTFLGEWVHGLEG